MYNSQPHAYSQPSAPSTIDSYGTQQPRTPTFPANGRYRDSPESPARQIHDSPPIATIDEETSSARKRKRLRQDSFESLPSSLTRKRTSSLSMNSSFSSVSSGQRKDERGGSMGSMAIPSSQSELLSTIFVKKDNTPMLFFVQVDIRNRMQIIQNVKVCYF